MVSADLTLYTVLGVSRHATDAQIRAAYRLRALATHPDKGGNEEEFLKVVEAFEILSDLRKRHKYDEDLHRTGSQDGRHQHQDTSSAAAVKADTFGLPDLGKTDPNQQPVEGWSATEETQRAKVLWLELLEKPISQRKEHLQTLSCRTAEVLLTFARAQFRGAPVVAGPGAPQDCGNALLASGPEAPDSKRAKLDGPRGCFARGSRAHVCLHRLKVCTGASEDLSEAINWHILLVRVKQLFDERIVGNTFPAAVRHSVQTAMSEASGQSDPRLRFVTECTVDSEVLFTPVSWDLEVALRQNQELTALLDQGAPRAKLVETIGHMVAASQAAEVEQRALIEELDIGLDSGVFVEYFCNREVRLEPSVYLFTSLSVT
eukprot:symbB.v1.2.000461.t1/scaffold11.1/size528188/10